MTHRNRWLLIKIPLSRNGHSSRIKILLSRNFRELHVYLSRGPCWPTTPLMKIRSPPAKLRQRITDHFLVIGRHATSITESLLRTDFLLQSLLAHPLQHALWLSPALSHNFRGTFAKISLFTDPGHQQGVHWRKSEDQGPWCLALAKPHFWKLGYCYSHSLVPFSCRTPGGSGWQPFTYNDYNTQLSRNFREIKFYFREIKTKTFARVSNITRTAFAIKTLYKDL